MAKKTSGLNLLNFQSTDFSITTSDTLKFFRFVKYLISQLG